MDALRSEHFYRTIFDNSMDAVLFGEPGESGRLLAANPSACVLFGRTETELCALDKSSLIDSASPGLQMFFETRARDGRAHGELVFIRGDGSRFWGELSSSHFYDEQHRPRVVMMIRDLSERKNTERELAESQALLDAVVDSTEDMIWSVDAEDFSLLSFNRGFRDYYLRELDIHLEKGMRTEDRLVDKAIIERWHAFYQRALKHGPFSIEYPLSEGGGVLQLSFNLLRHGETVFGISVFGRDITEHRKAEAALRRSEEKYRTIFQNSPLGIFRSSADGRFIEVNPAMARIFGYASPEAMVREVHDIGDQLYVDADDRRALVADQVDTGENERQYMARYRRRDGSEFEAYVSLHTIRDTEGRLAFFDGILDDVTEKRRAEEEREDLQAQLLHAQKMESIGRLAGGVAHDFNNMLGVIIGYAELALRRVQQDEKLAGQLGEIRIAAKRSADLTRQLLTFARKQPAKPTLLDLNASVQDMLKMLERMINEDIDLHWRPGEALWSVKMDPSQLDQILANLCVNARDAIQGSGSITIETHKDILRASDCSHHPEAVPGDYVRLSVSDTGSGMDGKTMAKVFEPFFTTKAMGMGTGLGLSTVYGIVEQNQGFIAVSSEPGSGTTFSIYLPRQVRRGGRHDSPTSQGLLFVQGHETILLVEDEAAILEVASSVLAECGYHVIAATSPDEAMQHAHAHGDDIRLLITDMIMPGMTGRDLADQLLSTYPDMACLFMSGYTGDILIRQGMTETGMHFIQKPFSMSDLTAKVRQVLDA